MFSQKTTWLISVKLGKKADLGYPCLLVNHSFDTREGLGLDSAFSTHNKTLHKLPAVIDTLKVSDLQGLNVEKYDVIGIDEGQFYTKEDMKTIIDWKNKGKTIYMAALDGDAERNFFGYTYLLIPHCDGGSVHKSTSAECMSCQGKGKMNVNASFTRKISGLTESGSVGSQVDPGADDKYQSVCGICYNKFMKK